MAPLTLRQMKRASRRMQRFAPLNMKRLTPFAMKRCLRQHSEVTLNGFGRGVRNAGGAALSPAAHFCFGDSNRIPRSLASVQNRKIPVSLTQPTGILTMYPYFTSVLITRPAMN